MKELICLFLPAIISTFIEIKFLKKDKKSIAYIYAFYLMVINCLSLFILMFTIENKALAFNSSLFTLRSSLKYFLMTVLLSAVLPVLIKYLRVFINKFKNIKWINNINHLKTFIIIFMLIQPIFDLYPFYNSVTTLIRIMIIFIFFVFTLFMEKDKKTLIFSISYMFVVVLFFIFHDINARLFTSLVPENFNYNSFNEVLYFIKMVTPLMFIYVVYKNIIIDNEINKYLKIVVCFISGSIILLNLFGLSFSSYSYEFIKGNFFTWFSGTYGFDEIASKGWFYFANHIIAILMLFLPVVYYFLIKEKKVSNLVLLLILMFSLLLLGNKVSVFGSYLFFIFIILCSVFIFNKEILNKKIIIPSLIIVLVFPILIYFSPAVNRVVTMEGTQVAYKSEKNSIETQYEYIKNNYKDMNISKEFIESFYPYQYDTDFWYEIMKEPKEKLINYRFLETKILNRLLEVNNSKSDILLGIGYDRQMNVVNVERDYLNQFYSVGIIGIILFVLPYFILLAYSLYYNYKKKNKLNIYILFGLCVFLLIAYLSGNLINTLSCMIPFSFFLAVTLQKKDLKRKYEDSFCVIINKAKGSKLMKKLKKVVYENKKEILTIILMMILFYGMDFLLRFVMIDEFYSYNVFRTAPNLFTLSYIVLFVAIFLVLKRRGKLIFFNVISISNLIIFITQYFHYKILGRTYLIHDIFLAGDAAEFTNFLASSMSGKFVVSIVLFIVLIVLINLFITKSKDLSIKIRYFLIGILMFLFLQFIAVLALGEKTEEGLGVNAFTPKNIYENYDNSTRGFLVSGLYKYVERNIYLYVKEEYFGKSRDEMKKEIDKYSKKYSYVHTNNDMTGIFEDRSVLYVLLESIDTYLINEETAPTIYKMQQEGLNFTNRYAPSFGGGRTFNSEFSMITGMYQPIKGTASTEYANNVYKYSFPSIFKDSGYISNSIHANDPTFYNRSIIHKSFGFENHYADFNRKYNDDYWFDTKVVEDDKTYKLLVPEGKFANYFATISSHGPYGESNTRCDKFLKKYPEYRKIEDDELACLTASVRETDEFFRLLLERLEKDNRLNDVVLVLATDHDAYGYKKTPEIKGTNDANELTKVPLIIWSNDIESKVVDTYVDTSDILPTLANMFNVKYTPVISIGDDAFSKEHENYVYFSDNSFIYNGKHYFGADDLNNDNLKNIYREIKEKIEINKLILDSDYYR